MLRQGQDKVEDDCLCLVEITGPCLFRRSAGTFQFIEENDGKLEVHAFFSLHFLVKIAFFAILIFLCKRTLRLSTAHRAGDNPARPSSVHAPVRLVQLFAVAAVQVPRVVL